MNEVRFLHFFSFFLSFLTYYLCFYFQSFLNRWKFVYVWIRSKIRICWKFFKFFHWSWFFSEFCVFTKFKCSRYSKNQFDFWSKSSRSCRSLLGVKILHNFFEGPQYQIQMFTDSCINLARLKVHSINQLKYHNIRWIFTIKHYFQEHSIHFRHVAGASNPADILTKFKSNKNSLKNWAEPCLDLGVLNTYNVMSLLCTPDTSTESSNPELSTIILNPAEHLESDWQFAPRTKWR